MRFGVTTVWQQRAILLHGLLTTAELAVIAGILAVILSIGIFMALIHRARAMRLAASTLVDAMRCVPFMLFCYLLYYGLPSAGITLGNFTVGIVALSIYHASYMAELLRGAFKEMPKDTLDAGTAFGFHGLGLMRMIVPPVCIAALPMLGNQLIQVIKDSAFLVIIAVAELTFAANEIQSIYYTPFASFICAVLGYWALCLVVEFGVKFATMQTSMRL
jgi:polar amino acid transport system permease protein